MGWIDATQLAHEGYAIGYVVREGTDEVYRELSYPDQDPRLVALVAAGCDCGWRSPRWVPTGRAEWRPFSVMLGSADEQRVHTLWRRHLELDVIGGGVAAIGDSLRRRIGPQ
jgi:hypothetical protein